MKRMAFIFLLLASMNAYSQNAFVDGIHTAGKIDYQGDGSESILTNFKVDFPDESSAIYTYTYHWKEDAVDNTYFFEIKWKWADISSVKIDKELYVVELNTAFRVMESSTYKSTNEKLVDDKALNADIYFKNLDDATAAAGWIVSKIKQCGGDAMLVDY